MSDEASYYGILPANVRYDERLKPMAKIMYTEITCLSNKHGFCYAKNKYFAELYNVGKETVSRWISDLVDYGYVTRVITYKKGSNQIDNRFLTINPIPIDLDIKGGIDFNIKGGDDKKSNHPIDKKVKDNSTSFINNININIGCVYCVWKKYPNKKGRDKSFKYIPKLIKKHGISKILIFIDRYLEDVKFQRDAGFKTLGYKNGSTFFNSGINDYFDDNYIKPGLDIQEVKKKINVKTGDFDFKPKISNDPELKKIDFDFGSLIKK